MEYEPRIPAVEDSDAMNMGDGNTSNCTDHHGDGNGSHFKNQMHPSTNDLNLYHGVALLTADCLGTGILALPSVVMVLGRSFGLAFLILQLPINLYAGTILCYSADVVEQRRHPIIACLSAKTIINEQESADEVQEEEDVAQTIVDLPESTLGTIKITTKKSLIYESIADVDIEEKFEEEFTESCHTRDDDYDYSTTDLIAITGALFPHSSTATGVVMAFYYCNVFLVLGDYILVMSHAVVALAGGAMCLPTAGVVASTLMFAVSQLRTMAKLGRSVSIISLIALFLVVTQCLISLAQSRDPIPILPSPSSITASLVLSKCSALASIGFAVGSQKLLLNIRSEMKSKQEAPQVLAISLTAYITLYVAICVLAGPNPPSFLFDAIAPGWNRRLGGLLLWIHVVVSYAINSQAICSSIDRLFFHRIMPNSPALRWMLLTFGMSVSSYLVANAVPFFKDLVSLIGALTSIPLSLVLPAILFRKAIGRAIIFITSMHECCRWSKALLIFAIIFTVAGLLGAVRSIQLDWLRHGRPFACY